MKSYSENNIFNGDETSLIYCATPIITLCLKIDNRKCYKMSEERVTTFF